MRVKGPTGFGDAIYTYPIIKYLIDSGENVTVLTRHPYVFEDLNCATDPYRDEGYDIDCNYVRRKGDQSTTQFEDMCLEAGIETSLKLEIPKPHVFNNTKRKICLVQYPYYPMNEDQLRTELMPDYSIMQQIIADHPDYFYVLMGQQGSFKYHFEGIDMDVVGQTDYKELIELYTMSDMIITQIGYSIALAEALNKRIFVLFSKAGLDSDEYFFRTITPKKVITKPTSSWAHDKMEYKEIIQRFNETRKHSKVLQK